MPAAAPHSLLISDLHLTPERPAANERFFRFIESIARAAQSLYILGDLFEAWVGDEDLAEPLYGRVAAALGRLRDGGTALYLMHGNRDFLLGEAFCRASAARLLAEPSVADLHGTPTLLLHGDSLCTDDLDYQAFRRMVRAPDWQAAFLARSLAERHALARELRAQSEQVKGGKAPEIMDVNPQAVVDAFRRHGVRRMIHGHTHRPARHELVVDGHACERWVLPDWYDTGGWLVCDAAGCRAVHG